MKDQDLQRLFDHFDAPSHKYQSIKRHEEVAEVLRQWPVLDEANAHVVAVLNRTAAHAATLGGQAHDPAERAR